MLAKYGNHVSYIACVFHPFKKVKKWGYCHWTEDNLGVFTYSQVYAIERMKLHLEKFQSFIWRKLLSHVEAETGIPDVIHVHYPANITMAKVILAYKEKGVKIVCTEHWTQVLKNTIDGYEKKRLTSYANYADAFLCVGPPLKEAVQSISHTNRELFVVPNIVNAVFKPLEQSGTGLVFIAVGVLFPHKQFDKIIDAFASAFKGMDNVCLKIVGDGPEAVSLKKKCVELDVSDQVIFTGKLNRSETAQEVASSDCLICYSNCETFGVPIIEGWACGLPVIATTAAAVREGWDDKLGLQVSPSNIEELKQSMQYIYNHVAEYDSSFIVNYAREHYSEEVVYQMLLHFYTSDY
jgi:glycosyltransferase involved in cell wall biosynthesis